MALCSRVAELNHHHALSTNSAYTDCLICSSRVQSAVVEYGFPNGHANNLTEEEERALTNFKTLCQEKGVYTPGGEGEAPSHDDPTLL